jgi:protocatechuate 3,4-dioxygenase beta subunit
MKLAACLVFAALLLQSQQPAGDQCFVAGRVVNAANGGPVRRVRLILRRVDNPSGGSGSPAAYTSLSDDHGKFAMKGMEPGKYEFSAQRAGFAETSYGARRPGRAGITLSLDAGQQLTGVLFRLTPHAVIAGRILDQDGDPVEGVQVRTERYRYTMGKRQLVPSGYASTDDLGEYRLFGLAPGRYYLEATYRSFGTLMRATRPASKAVEESFVPTYYPGTIDIGNATAIELAPGAQLRGMDFTLFKARTVHVRGRVSLPPDVKGQMVMITLSPRGTFIWDFMRRARVLDPQGTFDVTDVRPGAYTLSAQAQQDKTSYSAHQQLEVSGSHIENVVLNLSPGSEMEGQLRFEGQKPPSLTEIQIQLDDPEPSRTRFGATPGGEVREDGSFTLSHVGSEIYRVRAHGLAAGYYLKSVRIGDDELKETGIDTTRGATGPLLLTISDKAGQIEGVVLNAKQKPTAGAAVVLVPETKKRERYDDFKEVTTDQYGRFTLKTIEPGEYKLFAWEDMEPGEYMDPDFLKPVEARGYPVTIHEGSRESAELKLIPANPAPQ